MSEAVTMSAKAAQRIRDLNDELAAAHAKLAQMAAALRLLDDYHRIGGPQFEEKYGPLKAGRVYVIVNDALSDPDTTRAGRLWEKLMAQNEVADRLIRKVPGTYFTELGQAHAAVEAERGKGASQ